MRRRAHRKLLGERLDETPPPPRAPQGRTVSDALIRRVAERNRDALERLAKHDAEGA